MVVHGKPPFVFRMHWVHEPSDRAVASWTAPVLWRFWLARLHCQSARGLAHSKTWRGLRPPLPSWEWSGVGRFMGVDLVSLRHPRRSIKGSLDQTKGAPSVRVAALINVGLYVRKQSIKTGRLRRGQPVGLACQ